MTADGEAAASRPPVAPFEARYRIRFDEAGPDGLVRASTLLRLVQDVAWQHSGELGFDRAWYLERGLAWLVRTIDLELRQPIAAGSNLVVDTEITAHGRITARRRSSTRLTGGLQPAAVAVTDWVLIDDGGRPTRMPPEFTELFGPPTPHAAPGRVALGTRPPEAPVRPIEVRWADLDPNGHVNNAVYLDWVDAVVGVPPIERLPRRYRVEYLAPAAIDDRVDAAAWPNADTWSVSMVRAMDGREVARATLEAGL